MKSDFDGRRALVVINPAAGKHTAKTQLLDITELFTTGGLETTVYTTRGRGDATEIVRRRGDDFDLIVCRGGDGTLNETVNGLMLLQTRPLLGYIPAGSTNDLARTLYIPADTREAVDVILNGQPLWNDLGCLNGGLYFTYTASFGAFTECSYDTPQAMKNRFGHLAYLIEAAKSVKDINPIVATIKTEEGFEVQGEFLFCAVTNSISIAGMVKLRRREVGLNDGVFELMIVDYPKDVSQVGRRIVNVLSQNFNKGGIRLVRTRRAEFIFEDMIPWTVDGEYAGAHDRVVIENVHNAVRIFRR
jgi:YegS/Rv2252/BmrU family lipid kinase